MFSLVQFKTLANKGRIRNVIMASGITVNVFEPTAEVIDKILDIQEKWVDSDDPEARTITGVQIIKELFPLLTDLEGIEEMTDEEIQEVADNPSIAYIQLQTEVEMLLTEIYKTHVLSARKRLLDTDYHVEANKVNIETFNQSVALAVKNTGTTDLVEKIEKFADSTAKAAEVQDQKETQERIIHLNKVKEEVQADIEKQSKHNDLLKRYQKDFATQPNKDLSDKDGKRD